MGRAVAMRCRIDSHPASGVRAVRLSPRPDFLQESGNLRFPAVHFNPEYPLDFLLAGRRIQRSRGGKRELRGGRRPQGCPTFRAARELLANRDDPARKVQA